MKQTGGYLVIFILALASTGFFYVQKTRASLPAPAGQNILISQVQITGGSGKTENDFVELYNPNNFQINLKGHRLVKRTKTGAADTNIKSWTADIFIPANGYYLWNNSGYKDIPLMADATTTASISDDNGLAIRFGAADTGAIIDSVAWGKAQNAFIEGSIFPTNPGANQSLKRKLNLDTNDNSADFIIQENSDPKNSSLAITAPAPSPVKPPVEADNTTSSTTPLNPPLPVGGTQTGAQADLSGEIDLTYSPLLGKKRVNNFGDALINELVSDPADNEVEWIELYNRTGREIDLSGWWIEDGSGAKTKLNGILTASGEDCYKVIEQPAGNLNNGGDIIILYDLSAKIIDQIAYGDWADGDTEDNAPAAGDPDSLARKFDGYNTYNNLNDFAITLKPTKGASNIIQIEAEVSSASRAKFDFANNIFISEILPNPAGDDAKLEFIEIYNPDKRAVDLTGWSLSNENNKKINLEKIASSTIIQAKEYLAFFRSRAKIILHNDLGQVKLFQPLADKPFMTVNYKNVKEGWSYVNTNATNNKANITNNANANWIWSETPTPGAANIIKTSNHPPEVEFSLPNEILIGAPVIFDSSDTIDQDGDDLKYAWNFGDGQKNNLANPEHTYLKTGAYRVKLAVSDGQETAEKEQSVKVVNSLLSGQPKIALPAQADSLSLAARNDSLIINEIFPNPKGADTGKEWLELKNLSSNKINLINWRIENSNGKYEFKNEQLLEGGAIYILDNAKSKLALKNSSDVINLYNDVNKLVDQVEYTDAVQGESYARGANGYWFWTTATTPGEENLIKVAAAAYAKATADKTSSENMENYEVTDLEKIKEMEIGSSVIVKGTVAVEPGILGAQIFYVVGLQIYNYKKDFPTLKVGDYLEVRGELSQAQDELRLKTKNKTDINILEYKGAPAALALAVDNISEENVGQLITVSGKITDKKNSTLYLDDGYDEILIYLKKNAGLSTKDLVAGQNIAITGILTKTKTELRLLPRYQSDIVKINSTNDLKPQVLGEVASAPEWDIAARNKKNELFKYLLIIASGVIIILSVLFIKIKNKPR